MVAGRHVAVRHVFMVAVSLVVVWSRGFKWVKVLRVVGPFGFVLADY